MKTLHAGIRWRIDDDSAGARRDRSPQRVGVDLPAAGGKRYRNRLDAQGKQGVQVVAVEGLEEHNLIARIEQREAGGVERARRARGDEDFAVRVGVQAVVMRKFLADGGSQRGNAIQPGVDVVTRMHCVDGGGKHRRGNLGVADALSQVHATDAVTFHGHGANLGLDQRGRDLAEVKTAG